MGNPDDVTLERARGMYFEANGFGADGGYGDAWVDFSLGPVPFPFPNTPARVKAVRYHDLHHVLTGYATSTVGEFEIAGWELGAGCKSFGAAWVLNLGGLFAGLLVAPRKVAAAFLRGLRERTVYGEDYDALMAMTVAEARLRFLGEARAPRAWRPFDVLRFALAALAGLAVTLLLFALVVPLVPVGLVTNALRRRERARDGQLRPRETRRGGA